MPALADYLSSLHEKGVRLWVDDGQLRYHARKGALSAEELARLRGMKDDIVIELTNPRISGVDDVRLDSQSTATHGPVSFQQQWLLNLIRRSGSWPQAQTFAFHLSGSLEPQVIERSLSALVRRHDSLRARVVNVHGAHQLEVDAPYDYQLDVVPAPDGFAAEEMPSVRFQSADLVARCDSPAVGPMLRARLLRISEQEHYLILAVHRLAADCLSIGQMFRELWLQYGEAIGAQSCQLAAEFAQYRDYASWQQTTDTRWQQKHAAYWQAYLADARRIQWPADDRANSGLRGLSLLQSSFGEALSAGLRELGRKTQSLPAVVMLTLYVSAVSRWCGQRDFVVPFNITGRHATHDGTVGCFSYVVYLRLRLKGDERFEELLKLVSGEFYRAVFHQDFGRMASSRPDLLGGTFCQCLSWHPAELAGPEMYALPRQLGISVRPVHFQTAREFANVPAGMTDLDICFFDQAGDIGMLLIFRRDLFCDSTMERFILEMRASAEKVVVGF